jgi:hypothetical protein
MAIPSHSCSDETLINTLNNINIHWHLAEFEGNENWYESDWDLSH